MSAKELKRKKTKQKQQKRLSITNQNLNDYGQQKKIKKKRNSFTSIQRTSSASISKQSILKHTREAL